MQHHISDTGEIVVVVGRQDYERVRGEPMTDEGWALLQQTLQWRELALLMSGAALTHIKEMVRHASGDGTSDS